MRFKRRAFPARVISGLSSSIAVLALAGIPVTHRGAVHESPLCLATSRRGIRPASSLGLLSPHARHVVLLMTVENAGAIADALVSGGRPENLSATVLADGSLPTERIVRATVGQFG